MNLQFGAAIFPLALLLADGCGALAAAAGDRDWPCEQALVPEVAAAVVWDGPSVEGLGDRWAEDPDAFMAVPWVEVVGWKAA